MYVKTLIGLTLLIAVASAQSQTINLLSCSKTKTDPYCQSLFTGASNSSLSPVCTNVNITVVNGAKTITSNLGAYCLPSELVVSTSAVVVFNSTANVSVSAVNASAVGPVTCLGQSDNTSCRSGCCSSRGAYVAG